MALSKFDSVWSLLLKHTFVIDTDSTSEYLSCVICKKIVVDAVQSHVCGCQYCYKCINEYTHDGDKHCPGGKEDCKDDHIVLDRNAFRSMILNKKVSKLKANCPNQSCLFNTELIEMADHLRLCEKQPKKCPYAIIGCELEMTNKDTIVTHLHCDTLPHTKLLVGLITSMKNEIQTLRDDFAKSKLEVLFLKEELLELKNEFKLRLVEEIEEIKTNLNEQRHEIAEIVNTKLENGIVTLEVELRQVRNEMEIRVMEERNRVINEQRRQSEDARIERENVSTMVNDLRKDVNEMREERKTNDYDRERRMNNSVKLCPNIDADFVWRIDQCSQKKDKRIFSESFYANNYKLYLCVYISDGSDDVCLYCYIMKGDNDDKVQWPMRRAVTLGIIDQVTLRTYKSDKRPCAFDRPMKDRHDLIGGSIINYSSIKDKASIIVDDSLVVSCVITDP